jgi:bacillithiol synthase
MRAECLPISAVPHTTQLFRDFVSNFPKVQSFYSASPATPNYAIAASGLEYPKERRINVASVLDRQNRAWGAGKKTLDNIERLKNGASAIVTGQQVVLFGGPMFAILKALTAIKHVEAAAKVGVECVPVFWLASEDHDLPEVSAVTLRDQVGKLRDFAVAAKGNGGPVGDVELGAGISGLTKQAAETFSDADVAAMLRESYAAKETFANAFARLFTKLFADFGLILLDPADVTFHEIAKPLLKSVVERVAESNAALLARGKELESAGYHAQVKVTATSTPLFALQDGVRTAVHRANGNFSIGKEKLSPKELAGRIDSRPQDFSGNALFRPVIQDYLLPTLAYVGGPAEIAYFGQSEVLYKRLLGKVTAILPRASATIVDAKAERLLKKYGSGVQDAFIAADELQRRIAAVSLPAGVSSEFAKTQGETQKRLEALAAELRRLDPTLEDAAKRAASKMMYQISRLKTRAGNAETRKNSEVAQHAEFLADALYPHSDLQERHVAGVSFVGRQGIGWLRELYDAIDLSCAGHQVLYS